MGVGGGGEGRGAGGSDGGGGGGLETMKDVSRRHTWEERKERRPWKNQH